VDASVEAAWWLDDDRAAAATTEPEEEALDGSGDGLKPGELGMWQFSKPPGYRGRPSRATPGSEQDTDTFVARVQEVRGRYRRAGTWSCRNRTAMVMLLEATVRCLVRKRFHACGSETGSSPEPPYRPPSSRAGSGSCPGGPAIAAE
jgi:hypothetical protein